MNSKGGYGILTGGTTTRITVQCKYILHLSAHSSEELIEGDTLLIECTSDGESPPTFKPWVHTGMFVSRQTFLGETQENRNFLTIDNINYTDWELSIHCYKFSKDAKQFRYRCYCQM